MPWVGYIAVTAHDGLVQTPQRTYTSAAQRVSQHSMELGSTRISQAGQATSAYHPHRNDSIAHMNGQLQALSSRSYEDDASPSLHNLVYSYSMLCSCYIRGVSPPRFSSSLISLLPSLSTVTMPQSQPSPSTPPPQSETRAKTHVTAAKWILPGREQLTSHPPPRSTTRTIHCGVVS